ncbi:energy-coupling factor transporter transmembrane protein EcfT [Corynebacterium lizhenjunii]|uniref:Energy-coupling factor transporter transmembrane protein EcfT n=2 Tax=Corynebacterium lizhenjunii TaxID=2709394 RepID=A0A7T0KGY4_9CORY|nr:energy-coupling factor transporter transmembrane protein EcfT [Corynebacterium lizhenjunii]
MPPRTPLLDPRTVLLAVLVINATALSYGALPTLLLCIAFAACALATLKPVYGVAACVGFAFFHLGYVGLLNGPPSTFFAFTAAMCAWLSRFSISMAIGAYALLTLTPSTLNSALRRMRLPAWVVIPVVVFVRIVPIIVTEARAIRDAMVLRGLQPGLRSWLAHPARAAAMLVIPLLGAVVRTGDELAASAMVRGLGAPVAPSTTVPLAFKLADALAAATLALIIVSTVLPVSEWAVALASVRAGVGQ